MYNGRFKALSHRYKTRETDKMQVLTRTTPKRGINEGRPKLSKIQKIDENKESFRSFISKYRNSAVSRKSYIDWLKRLVEYCNLPDVVNRIGVTIGDNTDLLLFDKDADKQPHPMRIFQRDEWNGNR